jgi:uncharacterized protein YbjQ (UPF0145 family)
LIVVTTENVTRHRTVRMLGQCFGVVVRSRGLGGNVMAGLRSIVGGEIHEYTRCWRKHGAMCWIGPCTTPPPWAPMPS